jgi:hypothetical protein
VTGMGSRVVASAGIGDIVTGPPRELDVLAAFPRAVYLRHRDGLIAVVTRDGVHLPNALVLREVAAASPLRGCHVHQRGVVGNGRLELGHLELSVARWWRPRPALADVDAGSLARTLADAQRHLARIADPLPDHLAAPFGRFVAALGAGRAPAALAAGRQLVGRGPGLTPAGDDLVAGLVAAALLLAPAVSGAGPAALAAVAGEVGTSLAASSADATTAVSAALLRHAVVGEVARPVADLLVALTGRGALAPAVDGLVSVGATSGRDLATGVLAGARLVVEAARSAAGVGTIEHEEVV